MRPCLRFFASWGACACMATTAHAQLAVDWDCYLPNGTVTCADLANAYFESVPGLQRADDGALQVEIRSTSLATGQRYAVTVSDTTSESRVRVMRRVRSSRGSDQARMDVLALLHRGTMPFLRVQAPGTSEGGVFRLEAEASEAERAAPSTGWYFRPELGGEMFRGGVTVVSVNGGATINYSTPRWRLRLQGDVRYRYVDFELPDDQTLRGAFVTASGSTALVRSLARGFSAALLGQVRREPQNNIALRGEVGVGLEWLHRPFLESDATNVGVRYRLLAVRDLYVAQNIDGTDALWYSRHSLALFGQLHHDRVDVAIEVGLGAPVRTLDAWNAWGGAEVTLRVGKGLEFTLAGSVLVRDRALNEPADTDDLDPVTTVAGRNFGKLSFGAEVSLSYTFGNGLLHGQDQRWQ